MAQNNGWTCCGIPAPDGNGYDWRKKAEAETAKEAGKEPIQEANPASPASPIGNEPQAHPYKNRPQNS